MDMFVIQGGRPLRGVVSASGAKNAALPLMAAALLADGPSVLHNVPELVDVRTLSAVLEGLGMRVERWPRQRSAVSGRLSATSLCLQPQDDSLCLAPYDLVRRMRASVCVLGPLVARRRRACVSLPGGCNIGHRPIDLHLKGLAALGADVRIERGYVIADARRLRGAEIDLAGPQGSTVTGTCNVLCAATLAKGTTVIRSAAREPEVVDLAAFLTAMGARIEGAGTSTLCIHGVDHLTGGTHTVLPDRIEAATLLCAGLITGGQVEVRDMNPAHIERVLATFCDMGAEVSVSPTSVSVAANGELRAADCIATPYPGVPTDVQAQLTAVLTQAKGTSRVTDRVFRERFMHASELMRLGASVERCGDSVVVRGSTRLTGASVMASDLRASAALVLAGLAAHDETIVRRIYHLDRGYDRLESKLVALGADVRRVVDAGEDVGLAPVSAPPAARAA